MPLNRDAILSKKDIYIEQLFVDEWNDYVYIKTLSGSERDFLESQIVSIGNDGKPKQLKVERLRSLLAFLSLCDEQGNRLFTDIKDIEEIGKKSASALDKIAAKAQSLAGMSPADIDSLIGDLKNAQPAALHID